MSKEKPFDWRAWLSRLPQDRPFIQDDLPEFPRPNISLRLQDVVRFNQSFSEVLAFAALVCGTTPDKFCPANMLFFVDERERLHEELEEVLRVVEDLSTGLEEIYEDCGKVCSHRNCASARALTLTAETRCENARKLITLRNK